MRDDSKPSQAIQDDSIIYDSTRLYRAVLSENLTQSELCWQAQYYDSQSRNADSWERGGYYATPLQAIDGARRGKRTADMFSSLFAGNAD